MQYPTRLLRLRRAVALSVHLVHWMAMNNLAGCSSSNTKTAVFCFFFEKTIGQPTPLEKNVGEDGPPVGGGAGEHKEVPDHVQHACRRIRI
jgi:hypothetical protein